jgi:hypothetical protein
MNDMSGMFFHIILDGREVNTICLDVDVIDNRRYIIRKKSLPFKHLDYMRIDVVYGYDDDRYKYPVIYYHDLFSDEFAKREKIMINAHNGEENGASPMWIDTRFVDRCLERRQLSR